MSLVYSQPSQNSHLRIKRVLTFTYKVLPDLKLLFLLTSSSPTPLSLQDKQCSLNTPRMLLPQGLCTCCSLCLKFLFSRCIHGFSLTCSMSVLNDFLLVIFPVGLFLDTLSTIFSYFNILSKPFLYLSYPHLLLYLSPSKYHIL